MRNMNQEITTEQLILSSLVLDEEFVRHTLPYYSPDYFHEKTDKVVFEVIKSYLDQYNTTPNKTTLLVDVKDRTDLNEEELKNVEQYIHKLFKIDKPTDKNWLIKNAEEFCQSKAVYNAIIQSIKIYDGNDATKTTHAIPDLIKEAISVSFDNQIGMDFYDNTESRFNYYSEPENRIEFDIDILNKVTGGGVPKKTLNIILAGVHVGKSLTLVHLASSYAKAGYNVLYISNEMSKEQVFLRVDANLLNIPSDKIPSLGFEKFNSRVEKLKSKNYGTIKVKDYAPGSAHCGHFKHLLHELRLKQRFVPDVVLVDYLGIVASSRQKSANTGSHGYLTSVAEELRALAFDFDIPVWTAQQLNRCLFHKTPINTENGYKSLDELVIGDKIVGGDGLVTVEHIYPIEEQECYEITLKSGKKIVCSDKHLFPTNNGLKSIETGLCIMDSFYVKG